MSVTIQTERKERPILMHARSVRGILEGRKTQTRRIVKLQPEEAGFGRNCRVAPYCTGTQWPLAYYEMRGACWNSSQPLICPYGRSGDRLWVRETFFIPDAPYERQAKELVSYKADTEHPLELKYTGWRSSIHMPRWASRLTLEITDVRVVRVQEISTRDVQAEGVIPSLRPGYDVDIDGELTSCGVQAIREQFRRLWDDTNGKGAWERQRLVLGD